MTFLLYFSAAILAGAIWLFWETFFTEIPYQRRFKQYSKMKAVERESQPKAK
jgi:hypothetical protein